MNAATLSSMTRAQLEDTAEDYDIDHKGMDDATLRQAILDAENGVDTSVEDARELALHIASLPKSGDNGECPHCRRSTMDGSERRVTEFQELSPGSQRDTDHQYTCNNCAGEWGPMVEKPKRDRAPSGSSNGLKIEKDREQRNGVTRPSIGGKCRGIWDELDAQYSVTGGIPTAKAARDALLPDGFDKTTIMVQYYRWRKFMGVEGRQ
jgi:hypothetical protein